MDKLCPYQIKKQPKRFFAIALAIILHLLVIILIFFQDYRNVKTKIPRMVQTQISYKTLNEVTLLSRENKLPQFVSISKLVSKPLVSSVKIKKILITTKPDITLKKENNTKIKQKKITPQKKKILKQEKYEMNKLVNNLSFEQKKQNVQILKNEKLSQKHLKFIDNQININNKIKSQEQNENFNNLNYINQLKTKIYLNTIFYIPTNSKNNASVEYLVKLLPDGYIRSIYKLKPSGLIGFDEAVERAIQKSQPFPENENGKIPSHFTFTYKPYL